MIFLFIYLFFSLIFEMFREKAMHETWEEVQMQCSQEYDWMYLCIVLMRIVFKSVSELRKDVLLKIPAFCLHETKKFRLKWNSKVYWGRKQKSKLWYWVTVAHFNIWETSVSNILNAKALQKEFEFFKSSCKKMRHGQYHLINEILTNWYKKCTSASLFPDGSMLNEEAMLINER